MWQSSKETQDKLTGVRASDPRIHDLLNSSGKIVASGLSEYEMMQEVRALYRDCRAHDANGMDHYEVHYVTPDRTLDALPATTWLARCEDKYHPKTNS